MPKKPKTSPEQAVDTKTVTVTQMTWTPCENCGQRVFYLASPGSAAAALTEHYNTKHQNQLALA